jgi:hypothetical protein
MYYSGATTLYKTHYKYQVLIPTRGCTLQHRRNPLYVYQPTVALSSTEAEFVAASDTGKSIICIQSILMELGCPHPQRISLTQTAFDHSLQLITSPTHCMEVAVAKTTLSVVFGALNSTIKWKMLIVDRNQ